MLRRQPRSPARRPRRPCCCAQTGLTCVGRQQLHLVAQAAEHARPVVRAAAGLHHDAHRLQLREVRRKLGSRQLLAADLARLGFNPVQLHHVLCNVQTVSRTIHLGPPSAKFIRNSTLALDAVRREAPPHTSLGLPSRWREGRGDGWLHFRSSVNASIGSGWEVSMPSPGGPAVDGSGVGVAAAARTRRNATRMLFWRMPSTCDGVASRSYAAIMRQLHARQNNCVLLSEDDELNRCRCGRPADRRRPGGRCMMWP